MQDDFQTDIDAIGRIESVPAILEAAQKATGMGFVAIARVTEDRWITCRSLDKIDFGMGPGDELEVGSTICNEIRSSGEPVLIEHVSEDTDFCNHPTPAKYGFQSYISVPIRRRSGAFFGTLCAIDPKPAAVKSGTTLSLFNLFAEIIGNQLEAEDNYAEMQEKLSIERETSRLREEFMGVLGHDLRNPVASVASGARILLRKIESERERNVIKLIQSSTIRMSSMIDNLLDLTRVRLGNGLGLNLERDVDIEGTLRQIVEELSQSHPGTTFETNIDTPEPVTCDAQRIGQLVSNLLGNALTHGADGKPVGLIATTTDDQLKIEVSNQGEPIPEGQLANLFKPYVRGDGRPSQQGLGLGLYIASEIAQAHHGRIDVDSNSDLTRFTFHMPLEPPKDA